MSSLWYCGICDDIKLKEKCDHCGILPLWVSSPGLVRISSVLALTLEETFWKYIYLDLQSFEYVWGDLRHILHWRWNEQYWILDTTVCNKILDLWLFEKYIRIHDVRIKHRNIALQKLKSYSGVFLWTVALWLSTPIVIFYRSLSWGIYWGWCEPNWVTFSQSVLIGLTQAYFESTTQIKLNQNYICSY